MLHTINERSRFDSNLSWAMAEYAAIQQIRKDTYPDRKIELEPGPKSALFARLLSGKPPLAFPPPLSFQQPWYESVEAEGPFFVQIGGVVPVAQVRWPEHGDLFVDYLLINDCPWGIVSANPAANEVLSCMARLKASPQQTRQELPALTDALLQRPEWIVKFNPWQEFRVYLGRTTRQDHRERISDHHVSLLTLDGTNLEVKRVVTDGAALVASRSERVAHLRKKPLHFLSSIERTALADADKVLANPSAMDVIEYECDAWQIKRLS